MFDKYIIVGEEFRNVLEGGKRAGFQFGVRLPYYRGIQVQQVDNLEITVDGNQVPRDQIHVTLHGNTYTLDEFLQEEIDRWEFGEVGIVTVARPGGLLPGEHKVELAPYLRIGYWPATYAGKDTKMLTLTQ